MLRNAISELIKVKVLIEKEEEQLRFFIKKYSQTGEKEFFKEIEKIESTINRLKLSFETLDRQFPRNRS